MSQDVDPTEELERAVENLEKVREPIYPEGTRLNVPKEAVRLTFFTPDSMPTVIQNGEAEGEDFRGIEVKTPIGVKLPVFEGPLDLLLHLIKRDRLEIYDIPIAHMTEEYLSTLGLMQVLDLDVAGDFLVMAATLMRIKARMLLPVMPDEEEDEEDPRSELVVQLLEYRRFKEAAATLRSKEESRRHIFSRGWMPDIPESDEPPELAPMPPFILIDVMKDVLARVGEEFLYEVELEDVSLEEKLALVMEEVERKGRVLFTDLLATTPRKIHVVVTLMALLELSRLGRIAIAQEAAFGHLWVYRVKDGHIETPIPAAGEGDHDGTA